MRKLQTLLGLGFMMVLVLPATATSSAALLLKVEVTPWRRHEAPRPLRGSRPDFPDGNMLRYRAQPEGCLCCKELT